MKTKMKTMDLNLDAGESAAALTNGFEEKLYQCVTSVNIACGGHTGNSTTMAQAVTLAKKYGLAVGAHPSFPDTKNFGREILPIEPSALVKSLTLQILALKKVCDQHQVVLTHVKPHGALYNHAAQNFEASQAIIHSVQAVDPSLAIVMLAGSASLEWIRAEGMLAIPEGFVDRGYECDGTLRSRKLSDALIEDPERAANQALQIAESSSVGCSDGSEITVRAETLCIHGDTPNALFVAQTVKKTLQLAGFILKTGFK